MLPGYVQRECQAGDHVIRFRGVGGWVNLQTGQWWPPALAYLDEDRRIQFKVWQPSP
jgi:hypothetical protein